MLLIFTNDHVIDFSRLHPGLGSFVLNDSHLLLIWSMAAVLTAIVLFSYLLRSILRWVPPGPIRYFRLVRVKRVKKRLYNQIVDIPEAHGVGIKVDQDQISLVVYATAQIDMDRVPARFIGYPVNLVIIGDTVAMGGDSNVLVDSLRGKQKIVTGGASGANRDLPGNVGTLGCICRSSSKFRRKKRKIVLSNKHVLCDLQIPVDDGVVVHPSPGEPVPSREIGSVLASSSLDTDSINQTDAAISELWNDVEYSEVIPGIGRLSGLFAHHALETGKKVMKTGRSTGRTTAEVDSIFADFKVYYERLNKVIEFQDQIVVASSTPFVETGDSGSILVDEARRAVGLIFAGANSFDDFEEYSRESKVSPHIGLANPIYKVQKELKIEVA